MHEAENMAALITAALPNVKHGTLRFWGSWFGRPHDNIHRVIKCAATRDTLRIYFDEGEVLTVLLQIGLSMDKSSLRIDVAERVRWEWFYYGRPKTDENLCLRDFVRSEGRLLVSSDGKRYGQDDATDVSLPAVEIL
jgi:hypothetical protein